MSIIFNNKDSVFFVGGRGTKVGDQFAGSCTQDFWNSSQSLADVMGANGEPMSDGAAWGEEQEACTVTDSGINSRLRITLENAFTACSVGLIANVEFAGEYNNGRYEVLRVDTEGDWIDIDAGYGDADNTCDVKVGGAFSTLQKAIDRTDAGNGYNVKIYTNKAETLTAAIDFDTGGGSIANNSHKIIEGFHTQPGDMNYGGAYYQGPLDCLINGVDTDKCVVLDADGGGYDVIVIADPSPDGLVLKNLYLYNTDKASGHNCIDLNDDPRNLSLINCRFDTAYSAIAGTVYGIKMQGCYIGNDFSFPFSFNNFNAIGGDIVNCVFNADGTIGMLIQNAPVFEHCLFWKSSGGMWIGNAQTFNNCVFYGQTDSCFTLSGGTDASIRGHNNIFMPAEAADFVAYAAGASGSVCDEALRASCVWTIAGVKVTNHISVNGKLRQLSDVIEEDPQFVDAANGDFRPRNPVVLRGGKPDISGNPTQMGAILQKYQFGDRERIANMARLRIIR